MRRRMQDWTRDLAVVSLALLSGCGEKATEQRPELTGEPVPTGETVTGKADEPGAQDPLPERPEGHLRMLALLEERAVRNLERGVFVGEGPAPEMREQLEQLEAEGAPLARWDLLRNLALQELRLGETERAIELYEEAVSLHERLGSNILKVQRIDDLYRLGVANLRWGENLNCVHLHNEDSCIFPLQGGGLHSDPRGSEAAIEAFGRTLALDPENRSARWLLNLAWMTLGGYPDRVPEAFRIPEESLRSEREFPRLVDSAARFGLGIRSLSGGTIVDDFNGDGRLDVMFSDWQPRGQLRLFLGTEGDRFEDVTEEAGLVGLFGGLNMVQADYDADGDLDVLVLRGSWMRELGDLPNSLLRNDGRGRFTDVTFEAGLGEVHRPTQCGAFGDIDGDGDLDLFIGNEHDRVVRAPCQLFENQGDGTFRDIARLAGVTNNRFAKACSFGDYDGDGDLDLYVSNLDGDNRLYRNRGNGRFDDVARSLGVTGPSISFPCWFWDYDNDGALDLFAANYDTELPHVVAGYLDEPPKTEPSRLYRNLGDGRFVEVGAETGLDAITLPMGSNFGDLDGDGFLDAYFGTGYPDYESLVPNVLFHNQAGQRFANVTTASGMGHLQKGHAVAFADIDDDGDQDVVIELGGAFKGDGFQNAVFVNPGFGTRWIDVTVRGVNGAMHALHAKIEVEIEEAGQTRWIHRRVVSGGSFGSSPLGQRIGLGGAERIRKLIVRHPSGGPVQEFTDIEVDQKIVVVPGQKTWFAPGEEPRVGR